MFILNKKLVIKLMCGSCNSKSALLPEKMLEPGIH